MTPVKILVIAAFAIVLVKLVTSFFGRGDLPILNGLVTLILTTFACFELFHLSQALWQKFT